MSRISPCTSVSPSTVTRVVCSVSRALLAGRKVVDAIVDVRAAVGGVLVSDVVDHSLQVILGDRIAPRALAERPLGAAEHLDDLRRYVGAAPAGPHR